jgi:flagellar FliL protein
MADQPRTLATSTKEKGTMAAKTEADAAKTDTPKTAGGGRKKLIVLVLVAVVALAAVYVLVLKPKSGKPGAAPKPSPGAVVKLDPITVNLAAGHFLKLGLSLQASADAGEEVSGAKALDAAISLFTGRTVEELAKRDGREKTKAALVKQVADLYENKIYDVYFTDFVMQ